MKTIAVILGFMLSGCVGAELLPTDASSERIVLVRSSDNAVYDPVIAAFKAQAPLDVEVLQLEDVRSNLRVRSELASEATTQIVSLGTSAASFVNSLELTVPRLFTMALFPERVDSANSHGIALVGALETELAQFKLILPDLKRVVVLSAKPPRDGLEEAFSGFGVEARWCRITLNRDLRRCMASHGSWMEAIWIGDDPTFLTESRFEYLSEKAVEFEVPLLTSLSAEFAEQGALASLATDPDSLGSQLASLSRELLDAGTDPQPAEVRPALGQRIFVNFSTAKTISVEIPETALFFVSKVD